MTPLGNNVTGGTGNDIAILANGMNDIFVKDEYIGSVHLPIDGCQISIPVTDEEWSLSCKLIGIVDLQVGESGVTIGSDFYDQSAPWNPTQWSAWAAEQLKTLNGDLCICDPGTNPLTSDQML